MTDTTSVSTTTPTEPWYASTGFWASAIMLAVAILQVAAAIIAAPTFSEGVAAVDWTAWALGAAGLLVGIVRAVKGASPDSPTPRWTLGSGGTRGSITTTVAVLVMGAALVVMLALSSCAPGSGSGRLTPQQGGAVGQGVHLGCEMARLILNPEVTGVSPEVAGWVDRICDVGELVTVAVLPWVVDGTTALPATEKRLFLAAGPPVRTVAVSCEQLAAGCDQDGLDAPAAEACYEVLRGCREGHAAVVMIAGE